MMKTITNLSSLLVSLCIMQQVHAHVPTPKNHTVVASAVGDLDNDGVDELAVAYNTRAEKEGYESIPRALIIYKRLNKSWQPWKHSTQALYKSRDGGMSSDPWGSMTIKKGVLSISHNGGSSWKWGHTDKYRYQNDDFYLIGYTSSAGKLCEYWKETDFNLSTGKIIVKKQYESCKNGEQKFYKTENETFNRRNNINISMHARNSKNTVLISPRYKHHIYLATNDDADTLSEIVGSYHDNKCQLTIDVERVQDKYRYHYQSPTRQLNGSATLSYETNENSVDGTHYLTLEGIEYAEDYFDLPVEEAHPNEERYNALKKQNTRTIGVQGVIDNKEFMIQNGGNSMNYYVKLGECGQKYISLKKTL